jgi:hypothetical protein
VRTRGSFGQVDIDIDKNGDRDRDVEKWKLFWKIKPAAEKGVGRIREQKTKHVKCLSTK